MEKKVADLYESGGSFKGIAKTLGIFPSTVRKILIDLGKYETPVSRKINDLFCIGLSVNEIARALNYSKSTIHSYLPYVKGSYKKENKSVNAMRIEKHRKSKGC